MTQFTGHLPRISLAHLPTPLEDLPRLRKKLGNSPRILIKRDDQTGLATGGNKTRKLEFLIAHALQQGADTLITTGGAQSNHCRQTAAAAAKVGLRCILVLTGHAIPADQWRGNLLLDDLFGAELIWRGHRRRDEVMAETADKLLLEGSIPYIIPIGGSVPVGAAGYVAAVEELHAQVTGSGDKIDRIVVVSGSGGTHAGILTGAKALNWDVRVEGMNNFAIPNIQKEVLHIARETAIFLNLAVNFSADDVTMYDANGSHDYGVITEAEREATQLLARTEGILLDPVYTARAFAQMVTFIREGVYKPEETIVFWHTGGVAGLFPRADEMTG